MIMETVSILMAKLVEAVDMYKFYDKNSNYYTMELIEELAAEIEENTHEKKVLKKVKNLKHEAYNYWPMSELESRCMCASNAMRNPIVSRVIL